MDIAALLAAELSLNIKYVQNVLKLLEEGNTIPFIARYRKELTGSMDDTVLRNLFDRLTYLRNLEQRREAVLRIIEEQGKLTDELKADIEKAATLQELEDLYRPYKQKKRTRAMMAAERGLEPLAAFILMQGSGDPESEALSYIDAEKGVETGEDALAGAMDIIAEQVSDNASLRKEIRRVFYTQGTVVSSSKTEADSVYKMYYDFSEPVNKIADHRVLAINRGEAEGILSVSIDIPSEGMIARIREQMIKNPSSPSCEYIEKAAEDAFKRLIRPSVENETRALLTQTASEHAIGLFSENLKNLLLQPPVKERVVLGLDPAYRTGCKIAVVDEASRVLATTVIYPTPPQSKTREAKEVLKRLIEKHNVEIIAIGNGTASKESEIFVAELISEIDKKIYYMVVNEAGASVYSASKLGAEEFPEFDVSIRSAVSIARRLIDPLAELVKIEPAAIGVGQYQHDMNKKQLDESLGSVVENCVNSVGVNLNTASVSLLSYVAGINKTLSKNIVAFREENGSFKDRKTLKKVPKLGEKSFVQCAGFLRIPDSENILDNTGVHPEAYKAAEAMLKKLGFCKSEIKNAALGDITERLSSYGAERMAQELGIGVITLHDIAAEIARPGRDIRDALPKPQLRSDLMDIKDLKPGMVISGTVRNVIDFGAFVDIGVHQDGLVHISQISNKFIRHPSEVLKVGDNVAVTVLEADPAKGRISLTMKDTR